MHQPLMLAAWPLMMLAETDPALQLKAGSGDQGCQMHQGGRTCHRCMASEALSHKRSRNVARTYKPADAPIAPPSSAPCKGSWNTASDCSYALWVYAGQRMGNLATCHSTNLLSPSAGVQALAQAPAAAFVTSHGQALLHGQTSKPIEFGTDPG